LRQAFKDHILKVLSPDFAPIAEVFDHPEDPMTTRERLKNWYDEQQATSRAEGQRTLLEKLLKLKFGKLDASAEARLAVATSTQLVKWGERVLTAGSLEEVWT
jgi:hypothetical protein